ncbi:MAG: hypothetical protein LIP08_08990 [Bacteroides sp.]|nr:hypothetical protein [Bacteroides sp.]
MKANVFFKAVCVAVVVAATTAMAKANNWYVTNDDTFPTILLSTHIYSQIKMTFSDFLLSPLTIINQTIFHTYYKPANTGILSSSIS